MITSAITHDEAVIQHFVEDPELADLYLQTVLKDGDAAEIAEVQSWYNEAQSRKRAQACNQLQFVSSSRAVDYVL